MNPWIHRFDALKSTLVVACCLPPAPLERLEAALAPLAHDVRSSGRLALTRAVRRAPPDVIVVDSSYLVSGESPVGSAISLSALSAIAPTLLLVAPSAVPVLHHDPLARHAEWLIDGVDHEAQSVRTAIASACSQVPVQIVLALESAFRQLPFEVAAHIRVALGGASPDERLAARTALESMKPSTLRGQLARASLGRLRDIRRVSRLWSAYECVRLENRVHVAANTAGYRSERSLLNDSVALLGCSNSGLARVTCGRFLTAAVTTLDRSHDGNRNESLSA